MNQVEMRARLVEALEHDLIGPMRDDEVLRNTPSRWYLTGFLVPRGAPEDQRIDPTATEELDAGLDGSEDDDRGDVSAGVIRPFLPSSFGLSVLVPPTAQALEIAARWGEYERLSEDETRALMTGEEEPNEEDGEERSGLRVRFWRRSPYEAPTLTVPVRTALHPIPGSGGVVLSVVARPAPKVPGLPDGTLAVSIFLVNAREPLEGSAADERSLFQVEMVVRCAQGFQPRSQLESTGHVDDRRNDLQYRAHREWAVGHGVATSAVEVEGAVREVRTTWIPRARVYRMAASSVDGVTLDMEQLSRIEPAELQAGMRKLLDAYRGWIQGQRAAIPGLVPSRQDTARALMDDAERALTRIEGGIHTLIEDPLCLEAFRLTNQAMAMAARQARPGVSPAWRLFQLAFVLLNVRGVADPAHEERQIVDLLFFPTGGGKTEAYLGVAAFAMILRRLRHRGDRHRGAGVTVILRYTLRLLTLDQLGRAATLTCALELLRQKEPARLGDRRFSVGLWVGRSATANKLDDAVKQVNAYRMRPGDPRLAPPIPLVGCPWCGTAFTASSYDIHKAGGKPRELRVGCEDLACPFSFASTERGLPVVVVDEQLYRELPAFVIATVDKFASLPWRGDTGSLFGRVTACDEHGFYGQHEPDPRGAMRLHGGLPPPSLIIQDELHLITGPLGTMVGLYETAIDALSRDAQGHGPKIVASTATARRATEQIRALYARSSVSLFPPQGLDDGDTFFARTDTAEDMARLYVGVAAPGRSSKAVLARVYTTLLSASYKLWFGRGEGLDNPADTYMTLACYFNSLRELGGAQRLVLEEVAPRVAGYDRRAPVQDEKSAWFANRRLGFDTLELTSRQSTGSIRDAKGKLELSYSPKDGRRTDVLLASSMISVGVDIPRLGLMVVNGQPRTVAEYIQASSRVGRQTPGLVVTTYNLFKPRDRSHYERFTAFHECFYRYVEASSVTPFSSRAVERGLAGLTVGLARHLKPGLADPAGVERIRKAPDVAEQVATIVEARVRAHRDQVPTHLPGEVGAKVRALFEDWQDIAETMGRSAAPMSYSGWEKRKGATPLLSTAVDGVNDKHEYFEHFRAPTSMRDVEPSVHFWVNKRMGSKAE